MDVNKKCLLLSLTSSIEKIDKTMCPVLIVHGTDDDTIGIFQAKRLHQKCPTAVEPLWVEGAGHDDVEHTPEFLNRMKRFFRDL